MRCALRVVQKVTEQNSSLMMLRLLQQRGQTVSGRPGCCHSLTHSLTCLLLGVQIPPVHPVFVVIFGGVQVRVQTPLLFSAQNAAGSKKKDKKQNKTKQGFYQVLHDAKTKEKFKVSLCETRGRNQE